MEPAILCEGVTKSFGKGAAKVEALRGVTLKVSKGELRMLMGPSGSGKTTLISIIAGILTQDEGTCQIEGQEIKSLPNGAKTRFRGENIGFVFQAFNLIPSLTVAENVSVPLLLNGVSQQEALERSKKILEEVGIGEKAASPPFDLSGGQQQRVAIARALVHEPKIVVCDEPTSFLDHETGLKVMHLLRELVNKKGSTLIVVTHDIRIIEFADYIDHLEDGLIVETKHNHS